MTASTSTPWSTHELPTPFADLLRQPFRPEPASPQAQLLRGERLVHMPDASALHGPGWDGPRTRAAREAGLRALLMLPLRKDSRLLGYITANRHEPGPFVGVPELVTEVEQIASVIPFQDPPFGVEVGDVGDVGAQPHLGAGIVRVDLE